MYIRVCMLAIKKACVVNPLNSQTSCENMKSPLKRVTNDKGIAHTAVRKSISARLNRNM